MSKLLPVLAAAALASLSLAAWAQDDAAKKARARYDREVKQCARTSAGPEERACQERAKADFDKAMKPKPAAKAAPAPAAPAAVAKPPAPAAAPTPAPAAAPAKAAEVKPQMEEKGKGKAKHAKGQERAAEKKKGGRDVCANLAGPEERACREQAKKGK